VSGRNSKPQRSKRWRFVERKCAVDAHAERRDLARLVVVRGDVVSRPLTKMCN
jgi:hypothetical protein